MRQNILDRYFRVSAYDMPTQDKIPVIRELLPHTGGLALDMGSGTGYTTYSVFGERPTVCVDLHMPNLDHFRSRIASITRGYRPMCVVAHAAALPFRAEVFGLVLCSEVLEHLEDDRSTVKEISRVLTKAGQGVITVPYAGLGFTSFLELFRVKTVHDFPGPEQHVRPGCDVPSLQHLLGAHGLEIVRHAYCLRIFTRLVTDSISLVHLLYQKVVYRRRAWSWSDAALAEGTTPFRIYSWLFPVLWTFSRLDLLIGKTRGFGLVVAVRKRPEGEAR